ncbi:DNA polymerase III subunit gamma/tau [Zobellella taiwanensis]|uniref:DNA polymerase III subunit gamma/tau n=1 Tax=Zobellella taiwanensis TaxID=347535 RepID=A0A2P7RDS0_9GAMM|nr:DNA polymerase III subunit gamma/tau [Zobellella taiwanensis]PSJ48330.1 DNA polymerase III subunit gamma/tau [Zobellella taiwanensis]
MSYQVLARKWRPRRFSEVVGQQHVLTALVNALTQGRLHHAYLFSGTRGVGKTSIARLLAKALNCDGGITAEPCGQCGSCLEIEQGRFVDLLEIDAASRTKVEDTRELLDNVQYQPARGRFKVYLIDEVHMLSRHSFNALLKTLEEPPPHVKFLLATTDPQKLPITILSRCLQFHLKSLDPRQIDGQLRHILEREQLAFEPEATAALARAADGSLRDALSLTDQALAFGNGALRLAQVESMLGNLNCRQLLALVEAMLAGDGAALMARVAELASLGPDYDQVHRELIGFWHHLALAQVVPARDLPYANELNRLAPLVPAEQIQLYYQICLQGRKDLPYAPDGRSALEMTLLRALAFAPGTATKEMAAPKKPEPAAEDDTMSARLALEQAEILQEAARMGAAGQAAPMAEPVPAKPEVVAVPGPAAEPEAVVMPGPAAEPEAVVVPGPAREPEPVAAPMPAHRAGPVEPESEPPLTEMSPDTGSEPVVDEAAEQAARIRRLLQTRNRLLGQEQGKAAPASTREPVARARPEPAAPRTTSSSSSAGAPAGPAGAVPRPPAVGNDDLPPLDAYDDLPWDDDSPPWQPEPPPAARAAPAAVPARRQAAPVTRTPAEPVAQSPSFPAERQAAPDGPALLRPAELLPRAEDPWARLVAELPLGGLLRQLAMHSSLERDGTCWRLWLKSDHRHLLNDKTRQELEAAMAAHLEQPVQLEVALGERGQTPFEIEQLLYQAARAQARDEIEADDAVQFFISRFAAELDIDSIEPMAQQAPTVLTHQKE